MFPFSFLHRPHFYGMQVELETVFCYVLMWQYILVMKSTTCLRLSSVLSF